MHHIDIKLEQLSISNNPDITIGPGPSLSYRRTSGFKSNNETNKSS